MKFKYFIGFLIASCNDHYDDCKGRYYIQTAIPEEDRIIIRQASQQLNEWLGGDWIKIADHKTDDYCPVKVGANKDGALGYQKDDDYIRIDLNLLNRARQEPCRSHLLLVASMHEFMHGLNMEHISEPNSIMYYQVDCSTHFTDADRDECRRVGVCK